jgi:enoyl-CoA hydratase/carnithine racemase
MRAALQSEQRGSALVLTISNPEQRNALGPEIYQAGMAALELAQRSSSIRSIVITGEGAHFCAGGNLNRLLGNRQQAPQVQADSIEQLHAWISALRRAPQPIIAAAEGACAGAGFSLALACDFLVAANNAVFVMAYSSVGLSPDGGATWSLARALPRATVSEILMLGERLPAQQLHDLGLVNRLTEPGRALAGALDLAQQLGQRAPNVLASLKALIGQAQAATWEAQLNAERDAFVTNLHHANGLEGIDAFLNKRKPNYGS